MTAPKNIKFNFSTGKLILPVAATGNGKNSVVASGTTLLEKKNKQRGEFFVPQAQRVSFALPGDSRTAFGFNFSPTDTQVSPPDLLWPTRLATHGYTSWWNVKFNQFSDIVSFNAIAGAKTAEIDSKFDELLASLLPLDPNRTYIIPLLCGVINTVSSSSAYEDGVTAAYRIISMRDRALALGPNVCVGLCTDAGAEGFTPNQITQLILANNIIKSGANSPRVKVADLADEIWAADPVTTGSITFKAGYSYDGIHRSEKGARADGIRFYNDVVTKVVIPVPAVMPPVNLIQNSNYATPGGTLGTNVTGAVPANFSVTLENTTALTEAVSSVVSRDGKNWLQLSCKQGSLGASPLAMLLNISGYNLNTSFVQGDEIDWFIPVRILQGSASLLALDFRLGITYSSGQTTQSNRIFSYSTGRGDMYSDSDDDLLLRVPRAKINGTVSAISLTMGMRKQNVVDAVGTTVQIGQMVLGKKA